MMMYCYTAEHINDTLITARRLSSFDCQMMVLGAIAAHDHHLLTRVIAKSYL